MKENTVFDKEIETAVFELTKLCCDGVLEWFSSLWDSDIGGFYCSDSARDYEGFLPDIESTKQILNFCGSSIIEHRGEENKAYMPAKVKEKVSQFVKSLVASDGYVYHPQWGCDIDDAKRDRDLSSAKSLAKSLGFELFDDDDGESNKKAASKSCLPPHLASREAFMKFLNGLDSESKIHNKGEYIKRQYERISSAGLTDTLIDYLDSLQEQIQEKLREQGARVSGYWQNGKDYASISELCRFASIYNSAHRSFAYHASLIDSVTEVILSDSVPNAVIHVYNPWIGLAAVVENMKIANEKSPNTYDVESVLKKIRDKAPKMIRKTTQKLKVFKKKHGFSYYPDITAPYAQGVRVALGTAEGDVNASVIAIRGIRKGIYEALGCDAQPPVWGEEELSKFFGRLESAQSVKKSKIPRRYRSDSPVKK